MLRVDSRTLQLGKIPSDDDFAKSMTTYLDQELEEAELDTLLVDAVEYAAIAFLNAAGLGAFRLCPLPV